MKPLKYNMMDRKIHGLIIGALLVALAACEGLIEVGQPTNELTTPSVFSDEKTADAAVLGLYRHLIGSASHFAGGGLSGITFLAGISADEVDYQRTTADERAFYLNSILPVNSKTRDLWVSAYTTIYHANAVMEGLAGSAGVSGGAKSQLWGEAKFIRAFCNFYLVNGFGPVPLVMTTDYRTNRLLHRTPVDSVYASVISDLVEAESLLPTGYAHGGNNRVRVNDACASALLARVYLFSGQWGKAEQASTRVLSNVRLYDLQHELEEVFLKNSGEAIWQLFPVANGQDTREGATFIPTARSIQVSISEAVLTQIDDADRRRHEWLGIQGVGSETYVFPSKYKIRTRAVGAEIAEYAMVLRIAEQYLIRAEARLHQGNLSGALDDLNKIRRRAGLEPHFRLEEEGIMEAIVRERMVEFMFEWGHRWFDLKRWNRIDGVLGERKPGWQPHAALFPIPESELSANPNLQQNHGY